VSATSAIYFILLFVLFAAKFPPHAVMQALLLHKDVLPLVAPLVAAHLTREEAGMMLAPLCKVGAAFVRDCDKAAHAGLPEPWREGTPMWNVDRTRKRIWRHAAERRRLLLPPDNDESYSDASYDSYCSENCSETELADFMGCPESRRTSWLTATASRIDFCRAAGFVELVFDRAAACDGKPCSLLGCHTLRVIDPMAFLRSMQLEEIEVQDGYYCASLRWGLHHVTRAKGTRAVVRLLLALGLRWRKARFAPHPEVHRKEPLWHREYVADGRVFLGI
jgi:hypothetical protein